MSKRTTGKIARFTLDADTPLSADEQAMLVRLAAMPDSAIDYSDIPPSSLGTCVRVRGVGAMLGLSADDCQSGASWRVLDFGLDWLSSKCAETDRAIPIA